MKAETIKEPPNAAATRRAVVPTSGQASPEAQSNKSAETAGSPLFWWAQATTDLLRTWGQFSQLGLQPVAGQRSIAATKPATQVPPAPPEIDPPTSGDRLFHATLGRFTEIGRAHV